ncbi:MAG: hypothetical protein RL120_10745 [Gammaproteobacteria bacterium]
MLCLLLFFVQATALNHFHDDGPQVQVDCEFCLKISPADSSLQSTKTEIKHLPGADVDIPPIQSHSYFAVPAAKSRAPPLA